MNKIKYEKRMKELDQIAEEQQLRRQVRDRERELGLRPCLGCFGRMHRNPQKRTPRAALCTT